MTYSDFSSDCSSSPVVFANSPIVELTRECRTKSHHDCSTFGRVIEEPVLHASPLTFVRDLGEAI